MKRYHSVTVFAVHDASASSWIASFFTQAGAQAFLADRREEQLRCWPCNVWRLRRPRIERLAAPEEYHRIDAAGKALGEKGDCTVIAFAVAGGIPYAQAHAILKAAGRRDRHGFRTEAVVRELTRLGKKVSRISPIEIINRYPGQHKRLRNVTTHHPDRFPGAWADGKTYLLRVSGHVGCVVNGRIIDWSRSRALRVVDLYEVT